MILGNIFANLNYPDFKMYTFITEQFGTKSTYVNLLRNLVKPIWIQPLYMNSNLR